MLRPLGTRHQLGRRESSLAQQDAAAHGGFVTCSTEIRDLRFGQYSIIFLIKLSSTDIEQSFIRTA